MHSLQYTGGGYFPLVKSNGGKLHPKCSKGHVHFVLPSLGPVKCPNHLEACGDLGGGPVWANKPNLYTRIPGLKIHLNSPISVGGKIRVKIMSVGHTNFPVKVESTWAQNPWSFPKKFS